MTDNHSSFDNDEIIGDGTTDCSLSVKKNDAEHYDSKEISPLTNFYKSSRKKNISKEIEKLDNTEAKRFIIIKNIIIAAQAIYTVEYAKRLIKLARYYRKELAGFELSIENEEIYLENIHDLENCKYGIESTKMEELVKAIRFISELEERLEKKGLIQKKPFNEEITNRIARKAGDSK